MMIQSSGFRPVMTQPNTPKTPAPANRTPLFAAGSKDPEDKPMSKDEMKARLLRRLVERPQILDDLARRLQSGPEDWVSEAEDEEPKKG